MPTLTQITGYMYNPLAEPLVVGRLTFTLTQDMVSMDGTKVAPLTIAVDLSTTAGLVDVSLYATVGASPAGLAYFVEFDPAPLDTSKLARNKVGYWNNYWSVPDGGPLALGFFLTALRGEPMLNYMPVTAALTGATGPTGDVGPAGPTGPSGTGQLRHAGWYNFFGVVQIPGPCGLPAASELGTLTENSDADHSYRKYSTVTNGAYIGVSCSPAMFQARHDPRLFTRIKTGPAIGSIRIFVGFGSGTFNADAPANHYAGVRFSVTAPDTSWVGVTGDGTSQSITSAIGPAVAVDTMYEIDVALSADGTFVTFTVNGVSLTLSTTMPGATTGILAKAIVSNLALQTMQLNVANFYVDWD